MTTTGVRGIGGGAFARFLVHPRPYSGPLAALIVVFLVTLAANHFHLFSARGALEIRFAHSSSWGLNSSGPNHFGTHFSPRRSASYFDIGMW